MNDTSQRWHQIAQSEFPWEREALAFVRQGLPDHEPYRAWSNLEFIAEDGSIHEVDLLVLCPKGFFLIEIKSWPGTLEGDATTWVLHRDGKAHTYDSPLLLANRKARKLASLLKRQKAFKDLRVPFVEPLVFLSNPNLHCKLAGSARQGVHLRDREPEGTTAARPGIVAALTRVERGELFQAGKRRIDRPTAMAAARALEEAGIRPTQRSRRIGDYLLGEMLFVGPNYQDWNARHVSLAKVRRRVRIYPVAAASGPAARTQLERAARREFEALESLSHPGLLKPLQLTQHELGLALVFEHEPKAVRLDHFLVQEGQRLGFEARLALVRQVAETLQYVHDKRLFHRALSPQSILVWDPAAATPALRIFNWQTAAQEIPTTRGSLASLTGTSHLDPFIENSALVYVAPEALTVPEASPEALDVFSLGALAFLIFSGKPPAASIIELHDLLRAGKGLQLSSALDGANSLLCQLVQLATHPVVAERLASVSDFLGYLEMVEQELTPPEEDFVADPLSAHVGDRLQGGFLVKKRLGKGSTAVVFLVERDGREQVLKLALDAASDERLKAEAEVLDRLQHAAIVELQGKVAIGDRFGLLLARAGDQTVAQRLRQEGRFQPELLQRFGEDLLQAMDYLERIGIPHRDLKPDNLGVGALGRNRELHLVLFDFSLARIPAENVFAGTRPYLDPFLRDRKPRRWDLQAERFAAAVTLYEMATGALPRWGDGQSDPAMLAEEVKVESDLLDDAVRTPLAAFFGQALRRDPRQRFDNAAEMLAAWQRAFEQADRATTTTEEHPDELARACAEAELDTSVSLLHLSTRAVNALERAQVVLVKDLLRLPSFRVNRLRGVGNKTRKELQQAIRLLTARLGRPTSVAEEAPATAIDAAEAEPTVLSLDLVVQKILPPTQSRATGERRVLQALFGLSDEAPGRPSRWPSQTDVAESLGLTRARVSQVLVKVRQRWLRNQSVTVLRDHIAELIEAQGGAMTLQELLVALLATRGSTQEEPLRTLYAGATLRAAAETEESRKNPRWLLRRSSDHVLFALAEREGEALLDFVEALGRKADDLADSDPLPSPQRAIELLQTLAQPLPHHPLPAERLLRLATSASRAAALSSRLEVYPRGLAPERALRLASSTLLGARELTTEDVRDRVASRFPQAASLPGRPRLDELLADCLGLYWDLTAHQGHGAYRFPELPGLAVSSTTTLPRLKTTPAPGPATAEVDPAVVDAKLFEDRLLRAAREGAFLALLVEPRFLLRAEEELSSRFAVESISLEQRWLESMRRLAQENEVDWDFVLRTDAESAESPNAQQLRRFAARALDEVEKSLSRSPRTILVSRAGLLARYGQMGLIERLRDRVNRRPAKGEAGLHGLWLLMPADGASDGPQLDGLAVPVLTRAQWARIPVDWIENRHRAGANEAVSREESP